MKSTSFFTAITFGLFIISCGNSRSDYGGKTTATEDAHAIESTTAFEESNYKKKEANQDAPIKSTLSSTAAVVNKKDTVHQFVRTADLKFKVKNVVEATYAIERIIALQNGFVTYTNLHSVIDEVIETPINNDSLLEITKYSVVNSMVIRVPNIHLDTALKSMASLVEFMDYRVIKADDVALQLLSNRWSENRNNNSSDRLNQAVAQQRGKLNEINTVEETIYERDETADAARLDNLALKDKIQYSTVNIDLYQRPGINRMIVLNEKNTAAFEPNLLVKLGHSLRFGWYILEAFILFVIKFWPLGLIALIALALIKKFGK